MYKGEEMNLLEIRNLTKTFVSDNIKTPVLRDISFNIKQGEFVAVMGQSGSGKSTLLYNISGMDHMTSGDVFIDGENMADKTSDALADLRLNKMGFIFQNNYLLKNLNILDNICLPGYKSNKLTNEKVKEKARSLMEAMDISDIGHHGINKVSGGQLQRAAVCRALINDPYILFADEPTGALNSRASREVINIFNRLNQKGMTILIVTHDPKIASCTDRIIYLKDGQIEEELSLGRLCLESERKEREEKTLNWLIEKGF